VICPNQPGQQHSVI